MTIDNLEKELKIGKLNSIYLLYGEELFLLENCLKKIKGLFGECVKGINYILIDEQNVSEIIDDIETPSFGYEKKLIIAKNTGLFKKEGKKKAGDLYKLKEKLINYINENLKVIDEAVVLVFIEEEADEKSDLFKTIDKCGVTCKFEFQKPAQIEKRIKEICNAYKVNIDAQTLRYFIECCGTNMQDLINEIRKLIEYAGEGGTINKADIDLLCTKQTQAIIFNLTDYLGKKQIKLALEELNNLLYNKEPIQKILITLYNHLKKLYFVKIAIANNKDVATSLNLKPNQMFLVNKYKMQAKSFTDLEISNIIKELIDLDYNYKIGKIDLNIGLETILCNNCSK